MNIENNINIHNRFDIEIENVRTGEITSGYYAENIVLNQLYSFITNSSSKTTEYIRFGRGTGTLNPSRTTMFDEIASKSTIVVETFIDSDIRKPHYRKVKIEILPSEHVGEIITEVGLGPALMTHALIKDSEGNNISIAPKTDEQQITIYATLYVTIGLPEEFESLASEDNILLKSLLGIESMSYLKNQSFWLHTYSKNRVAKSPVVGLKGGIYMSNYDLETKTLSTPNINLGLDITNVKIWGVGLYNLGILYFPNSKYSGFNFINEPIGIGDGVKLKFILPWSDINDTKTHKFYIDNVLQIKDIDYTLSNTEIETSITFITPPQINKEVSGDWWVDYIPKSSNNMVDFKFSVKYGEGI